MQSFLRLFVMTLAAIVLSSCGFSYDTSSYRFRLTIEVDTPQGLRTGSTVYQIEAGRNWAPLPDMNKQYIRSYGEAASVDLGGGAKLFSLLETNSLFDELSGLSLAALDPIFPEREHDPIDAADRLEDADSARAVVPIEDYPLLVAFSDPSDHTSMVMVDPRDAAATLGPRYAIRRIVVELTDDPVPDTIREQLPWLEPLGRKQGAIIPSGSIYLKDAKPINLVTPGHFSTKLYK